MRFTGGVLTLGLVLLLPALAQGAPVADEVPPCAYAPWSGGRLACAAWDGDPRGDGWACVETGGLVACAWRDVYHVGVMAPASLPAAADAEPGERTHSCVGWSVFYVLVEGDTPGTSSGGVPVVTAYEQVREDCTQVDTKRLSYRRTSEEGAWEPAFGLRDTDGDGQGDEPFFEPAALA